MTSGETEADRSRRHRKRALFDTVAELYDAARPGYPPELIEGLVSTAGVGAGSRVLEIGCGTGQLTRLLAGYGFALTAIDLGPSLVDLARRHLAECSVTFETTSFEQFDAPARTFDVIVSGTAFHWIDPEVAYTKAAELLRPGGWLAILETLDKYDDPLGSALMDAWVTRSPDGGAWTKAPTAIFAEAMVGSGLFGSPVTRCEAERRVMSPHQVLALEQTRATTLSYEPAVRATFMAELRAGLGDLPEIGLERRTWLTMAPVVVH